MRPIINSTFVSLDGVINHMEKWHFNFVDAESDAFALDQIMASDALLMGRKTYDIYASAWPGRDGDYAERINAITKYVASSTLTAPTWNNTTVLTADVVDEVRALKAEPGGPILMHGYGPVAKALLGAGLLDELHLWVHPALAGIGAGDDLLLRPGLTVELELAGQRVFKSGVVVLSYRAGVR
jgi:dihydrofolate reductase